MSDNKILVTGANGQLGSELKFLEKCYTDFKFVFTNKVQLDICNLSDLEKFVVDKKFNYIINCAAYTNVDKAEEEPELAEKINAVAVENLVKISEKYNIKLIHISTDYVFDGNSNVPLKETDVTRPIGVYGVTKLKGEQHIINSNITYAIIRTAWLYSSFGNNFAKTILKYANERDEMNIIVDQVGTPTYARDLAKAILIILPQLSIENKGVYHFSNEGVASWYDFAKEITNSFQVTCKINPIETKDYKTIAKRPQYSILNKNKLKNTFNIDVLYWKEAFNNYLLNK
jgi:dTDP-4-dehydrorhamnose reductase